MSTTKNSVQSIPSGGWVKQSDNQVRIDSRTFRNVLGQFCTGVTVITAFDAGGAPWGFACQAFTALSLEPPLVLFCPIKGSRTKAVIELAGKFCVNVLAESQQYVGARFGSREPDKFSGIGWCRTDLDLPMVTGSLAAIQCEVTNIVDGGDHDVVFGRVLALAESRDSGRPLLFYRGRYVAIEPDLALTTLDMWL